MFNIVLLTALGVGGATFIGSLLSFPIKNISHRMNDIILSFAAGIMLAATFFSLILPSMEMENSNVFFTAGGILCGVFFIRIMDKAVPHIHDFVAPVVSDNVDKAELNRIILFIMAIAIHNFPEGLAVGVSFAGENIGNAFSIAIGIALQNIPEGMITILPLTSIGLSRPKALLIALFTGATEVIGTLMGYFTVSISSIVLPFILAFAGGTMLYVVSHDMIPETHSHGHENQATYALVVGVMIAIGLEFIFR